VTLGVMVAWLLFAYWKQEQAQKKVVTIVGAH
jgi:hypothetical protein